MLRIYDGDTPLAGKGVSLNEHFKEQGIDLTQTRVQYFSLSIVINGSDVSISNLVVSDWEDGGTIGDVNNWR